MSAIFEYAKQRYIQLKGQESYDKLYNKVNRSDALTQLCGLSIRKGIPPTSQDFIYKATMMPSIYITFDNVKSTMAALIMLEIWNEQVNLVYNFCPVVMVDIMAKDIVSGCVLLH